MCPCSLTRKLLLSLFPNQEPPSVPLDTFDTFVIFAQRHLSLPLESPTRGVTLRSGVIKSEVTCADRLQLGCTLPSVKHSPSTSLPLVMPNCVLQHLFIIDGRHDGYGHNINVRLTQQRHESWPTLFQSRRFIGPPLKSDI